MTKKYFQLILGILLFIGKSQTYAQTYSTLISDKEYYDFIDKDILRDSVKILHHIFRKRIPLDPDVLYFKDSADYISKNNNANSNFFIFKHRLYDGKVLSNDLDTIFTKRDVDFFGEQLQAMQKGKIWKRPFINSILFDKVKYDKTDKNLFGRRKKFGVWGYSLPLFSFNRRYALIIKSDSIQDGYYLYKRDQQDGWELLKVFNDFAID